MPGKTKITDQKEQRPGASMRPQRNAGENSELEKLPAMLSIDASMRPQRNAGENILGGALRRSPTTGFNEAPAKCRGKPAFRSRSSRCLVCFNEAPAKCRGKPARDGRPATGNNCFNEAPAKCRGKLARGCSAAPCAASLQ